MICLTSMKILFPILFLSFGICDTKFLLTILLVACSLYAVSSNAENEESPNEIERSFKIASRSTTESDDSLESKFHLNFDTIIRTQESRSSGAKYLNDTPVASNHDCLTWCWETHGCNAVVFQQKAKGSCYMFDCGTPDNFHCKFTRHKFYISSIMKITQHSYDLSQWGSEVKHEKELAKLHSNTTEGNNVASVAPPSSFTTVETKLSTLNSQILKDSESSRKAEKKCHHYQFQCINNSECIAIYNVCDGIPQCPDASDESELHCPTQNSANTVHRQPTSMSQIGTESSLNAHDKASVRSTIVRPIHPTSNAVVKDSVVTLPAKYDQPKWNDVPKKGIVSKIDTNAPWPDRYIDNEESDADYKHHATSSDSLGAPFLHKHSQFVAANDPHVQSLNRWSSDYDEYPQRSGSLDQQYSAYESSYPRPEEQYPSNQLVPDFEPSKQYNNYRQDDVPYWASQGSLQDNSYPSDDFMQPSLRILNKPTNYRDKDDSYLSEQMTRTADQYAVPKHHGLHKYMDNLPGVQQSRMANVQTQSKQRLQPYLSYPEPQQQSYPDYPEVRPRHYETPQHTDGNMFSSDEILHSKIVNKLPVEQSDLNHHNHPAINPAKGIAPSSGEKNKALEAKQKKKLTETESKNIKVPISETKPQAVLDFKMSVTELFQSSRTHVHETNSAILALVLGLIITSLLVVLTICRVKTIRRRMSRKGRTLAHDADYLVNGMYL